MKPVPIYRFMNETGFKKPVRELNRSQKTGSKLKPVPINRFENGTGFNKKTGFGTGLPALKSFGQKQNFLTLKIKNKPGYIYFRKFSNKIDKIEVKL